MTRPVPRRLLSKKAKLREVAKADLPTSAVTLEALPDATRPPQPPELANDLLVGASAIATFMFGTPKKRRRVYWLVETEQLPIFKFGTAICARKSTILRDVAQREATSTELNPAQA